MSSANALLGAVYQESLGRLAFRGREVSSSLLKLMRFVGWHLRAIMVVIAALEWQKTSTENGRKPLTIWLTLWNWYTHYQLWQTILTHQDSPVDHPDTGSSSSSDTASPPRSPGHSTSGGLHDAHPPPCQSERHPKARRIFLGKDGKVEVAFHIVVRFVKQLWLNIVTCSLTIYLSCVVKRSIHTKNQADQHSISLVDGNISRWKTPVSQRRCLMEELLQKEAHLWG